MQRIRCKRIARDSRIESWSAALKTLEREKLITTARAQKPSVRVCPITMAGRRELKQFVKNALAAPVRGFPTALYGALLHLEAVSRLEPSAPARRRR